jgi:hypothetical protein
MARGGFSLQTGPNSGLCSENGYKFDIANARNVEISRNVGIGGIEARNDRPRCFWGVGSGLGLGHPSNCKNRPPTSGDHTMASKTTFCT